MGGASNLSVHVTKVREASRLDVPDSRSSTGDGNNDVFIDSLTARIKCYSEKDPMVGVLPIRTSRLVNPRPAHSTHALHTL